MDNSAVIVRGREYKGINGNAKKTTVKCFILKLADSDL